MDDRCICDARHRRCGWCGWRGRCRGEHERWKFFTGITRDGDGRWVWSQRVDGGNIRWIRGGGSYTDCCFFVGHPFVDHLG